MSPQHVQARDLLISVDRTESGLIGRQIEDQLRAAIQSGVLPKGSRLPSSRVLAEDIGVSRGVVSRAYAQLALEGHVVMRQGAAPTVSGSPGVLSSCEPVRKDENRSKIRYDLRAHLPEVSSFPRSAWLRSVRDSLYNARDSDLTYSDPRGLWGLRVELANYLTRARGVAAHPERIIITAGSTHALSLIGRVLTRRGETKMVFENPSHFVLRWIADAAGQDAVAAPVDEDGVCVDGIDHVGSIVVAPAHQFPTGVSLSPERRARLIAWAREESAVIVEDDYDAEFRYDGSRVGALQSLAPERVLYIGSTGKTFLPALRLGWAVLPSSIADEFALELSSGMLQVSGLDQLAFADFLKRGEFDRHLRRMRTIYRGRHDLVVSTLSKKLPELAVSGLAAGLHVTLALPSHELADTVRKNARHLGVAVETLSQHAFPGSSGPAGIIIGYGAQPEPALKTAIEHLVEAIEGTTYGTERARHRSAAA